MLGLPHVRMECSGTTAEYSSGENLSIPLKKGLHTLKVSYILKRTGAAIWRSETCDTVGALLKRT